MEGGRRAELQLVAISGRSLLRYEEPPIITCIFILWKTENVQKLKLKKSDYAISGRSLLRYEEPPIITCIFILWKTENVQELKLKKSDYGFADGHSRSIPPFRYGILIERIAVP